MTFFREQIELRVALKQKTHPTEAAVRRYFSKYVFLRISQYLQQSSCVGVPFKNSFFYRAPPVVASDPRDYKC